MTVHVVTDSSSCLPPEVAERAGVTVLDLYTSGAGAEKTTAGLGALELTATYARLLERGGDAGVVAIHLSKELSATWSNAVSASGIFDGSVRVLDTDSVGMCNGFAALKAAEVARAGGSLDEVAAAAQRVLSDSNLWIYVHKLDAMRKGGRLSPGQTLLSTALAIKPILKLDAGKVVLAAKTRTQGKAMDKLVALVADEVVAETKAAAAESRSPRTLRVAVHQADAAEAAESLSHKIREGIAQLHRDAVAGTGAFAPAPVRLSEKAAKLHVAKSPGAKAGSKAGTKQGAKPGDEKLSGVEAKLGSDPAPAAEALSLPEVQIERFVIADALRTHTGPSALAVATVYW